MTQKAHSAASRFFRSFTAYRHPVHPIGPIELAEARELDTYYEAGYDNHGRLTTFIKHLRQVNDGGSEWTVAYKEKYIYWRSGNLRTRRLLVPGEPDQAWDFAERSFGVSAYFNELYRRWFCGWDEHQKPTIEKKSLILHEQFTEFELYLLSASADVTKDNQWAFETTTQLLDVLREIVAEIDADTSPKVCAVSLGKENVLSLKGFDDPPPNLFGVLDEWRNQRRFATDIDTVSILPDIEFDATGRRWAADCKVGTITYSPVRAVRDGIPTEAFSMFLLTQNRLNNEQIAVVDSIFRRATAMLQQVIEIAATTTSIPGNAR